MRRTGRRRGRSRRRQTNTGQCRFPQSGAGIAFSRTAILCRARGCADSTRPDGHYALAMVLGRLSRTKGSKERVRYAKIIFDEATRASNRLQPRQCAPRARRVACRGETIVRISAVLREDAVRLAASWTGELGRCGTSPGACRRDRAEPTSTTGSSWRRSYTDLGGTRKRGAQLQVIAALPEADVLDGQYKTDAGRLLTDIKNEKDET